MKLSHVPALDGLRAIAVLMVLLTHFWPYSPGTPYLNRVAAFGWAGVDLFFVLSGFLISRILWVTAEQRGYYRSFYMRRTLRIFPLYYAVLTLVLIGLPLVTTLPEPLMRDRWMYFAYLSNIALAAGGWQLFLVDITWSLAIEEQFYLLWPTVVRFLKGPRLIRLCIALIVVVPILRLWAWDPLGWRWIHMFTAFRLDAFAMGAVVGLVPITKRVGLSVFWLGFAALAWLVLTASFGRETWQVASFGYSLTALTAAAAVRLAPETAWLSWRPLRHIGVISYGMYLLHPLCAAVTSGLGERLSAPPVITRLILPTLATIGVAQLSYWLWERPFLRMKDRWEIGRAAVARVEHSPAPVPD
jgi:peptidoglycan/LPS O-acetylase OafA/YrhL